MKIIHFSDIHIGYKDKEYSNKYADSRRSPYQPVQLE